MPDEQSGDQGTGAVEDQESPGLDASDTKPAPRPTRRPRPAPTAGYVPGRRARVEAGSGLNPLVVPIFAVVALLALVAAVAFDHFHSVNATASPTPYPTLAPQPTAVPTATMIPVPTPVSSKPGVALEANGVSVPLKVFAQERASIFYSLQQKSTNVTKGAGLKTYIQQQNQAIQQLVQSAVVAAYAKAHHVEATAAQTDALLATYEQQQGGAAAFTSQVESQGFTMDVVRQIIAGDATGQNVYNAVTPSLPCPCDIHARHILLKASQHALAITLAKELQANHGATFAALAKKDSTDTSNSAQGGDLGFFSRGQMVAPFEKVAFALKVGQVSDPVKTQFGWHIIQVIARRGTSAQFTKWLNAQQAKATVHIYVQVPKS